jgi:hypothetical protein
MGKILGWVVPRRMGRFGYDTGGVRSAYWLAGLGDSGSDLPPAALTGAYDLNQPGRVYEIKQALAAVGQADAGAETLWRLLTPDDVWDDATADEFVIFVSRWMERLPCYPAPLMQFAQGGVHPTFTGLLMLDAAYRYVTSHFASASIPVAEGCGVGVASASIMPELETFLAGQAPTNKAVTLRRPQVEDVALTPSYAVSPHPIPPPDVDAELYRQWTSINDAMKTAWSLLVKATTDTLRVQDVQAVNDLRLQRDQVANAIIAKAMPRQGTTTVETVGVCTLPEVYDPKTGHCVLPPPQEAGWTPTEWAILASVAGLVWWGFSSSATRRA